jgi:flagellin
VSQTTKFNETYLLRGNTQSSNKDYSYSYKQGADNKEATAAFAADSTGASIAFTFKTGVSNATANDLVKSLRDQGVTVTTSTDKATAIVELNGDAAANYKVITNSKTTFSITDLQGNLVADVTATVGSVANAVTLLASKVTAADSKSELASFYDKDGNAIAANALENYFAVDTAGAVKKRAESGPLYDAVGTAYGIDQAAALVNCIQDVTASLNIKFQVGADTSSSNKISINIEAMTAKGLGINGMKVSTTNSADSAVNTVAAALQKVSRQRSNLGSIQNRLEHTINNLDNVVENTTSAESAIRDTDMATEMVTYSNANILAQAGQAMLAQANQLNQGVLTLLG